jgi:hypothetical protein
VRVVSRIGQQVLNYTNGLFAGALILFENDRDAESSQYILALAVRHY